MEGKVKKIALGLLALFVFCGVSMAQDVPYKLRMGDATFFTDTVDSMFNVTADSVYVVHGDTKELEMRFAVGFHAVSSTPFDMMISDFMNHDSGSITSLTVDTVGIWPNLATGKIDACWTTRLCSWDTLIFDSLAADSVAVYKLYDW